MRCSFTKYLLPFLLLTKYFVSGQNSIVFDESTLKQKGATWITDILTYPNVINYSTVDSYNYKYLINYLNIIDNQDWDIFLDGIKISANYFGLISVNSLPVNIDNIKSVRLVTAPEISMGSFAKNGQIIITTKNFKEGLTIQGGFYAANESGDPGPYLYTDRNCNSEHLGPDVNFGVNYKNSNFSTGLYLSQIRYPNLKENTKQRAAIKWHNKPFIAYFASGYNLTHIHKNGENKILFMYSQNGDAPLYKSFYYGNSNLFLEPLGHEVSARFIMRNLGFSGFYDFGDNQRLDYSASYSANSFNLKENENYLFSKLDVNNYRLMTQYSLESFDIGLSCEQEMNKSDNPELYNSIERYSMFTNIALPEIANTSTHIGVYLTAIKNKLEISSNISTKLYTDEISRIYINVSYSEKLLESINSLLYNFRDYTEAIYKYNILDNLNRDLSKSNKITVDLNYSYSKSGFTGYTSIGYRYFNNLYNEQQLYYLKDTPENISAINRLDNNLTGGLLTFMIRGEYTYANLSFQLGVSSHYEPGSNEEFRQEWNKLPTYILNGAINYNVSQYLNIFASLTFNDVSTWYETEAITKSENKYNISYNMPSRLILNLSIQNWFFNKQFATTITLNNLLDNEIKYHPFGSCKQLLFGLNLKFSTTLVTK